MPRKGAATAPMPHDRLTIDLFEWDERSMDANELADRYVDVARSRLGAIFAGGNFLAIAGELRLTDEALWVTWGGAKIYWRWTTMSPLQRYGPGNTLQLTDGGQRYFLTFNPRHKATIGSAALEGIDLRRFFTEAHAFLESERLRRRRAGLARAEKLTTVDGVKLARTVDRALHEHDPEVWLRMGGGRSISGRLARPYEVFVEPLTAMRLEADRWSVKRLIALWPTVIPPRASHMLARISADDLAARPPGDASADELVRQQLERFRELKAALSTSAVPESQERPASAPRSSLPVRSHARSSPTPRDSREDGSRAVFGQARELSNSGVPVEMIAETLRLSQREVLELLGYGDPRGHH